MRRTLVYLAMLFPWSLFAQIDTETIKFCDVTPIDSNLRLGLTTGFTVSHIDSPSSSYRLYSIGDHNQYTWQNGQIKHLTFAGLAPCATAGSQSPDHWNPPCTEVNVGLFTKTILSASSNSTWDASPGTGNINTIPSTNGSPAWPQTFPSYGLVPTYTPLVTHREVNAAFPSPPPTGQAQCHTPENPMELSTGTANAKVIQHKYSDGTSRWFMAFNGTIDSYHAPHSFTPAETWRVYWAYSTDGVTWTVDNQLMFRSATEANGCSAGLLLTDMYDDSGRFNMFVSDLNSDRTYLFTASISPDPTSGPGYALPWSVASYPIVGTYPNASYTLQSLTFGAALNLDAMNAASFLPSPNSVSPPWQVKQASVGRVFDASGDGSRYYMVTPQKTGSVTTVELWGSDSLLHPFHFEGLVDTTPLTVGANGWEFGFTHAWNNFPAMYYGVPQRRTWDDFWYVQNIAPVASFAVSHRTIQLSPRICLAGNLTGAPPSCSPTWWTAPGTSNLKASVVGGGTTYAWTAQGATITAGQGTPQITYRASTTPGTTIQLSVVETQQSSACLYPNPGQVSLTSTANVQVDFADVSGQGAQFHDDIDRLARSMVTAGCGSGNYCPSSSIRRDQMAVFLIKAKRGANYTPPTATGIFSDVPPGAFGADYVEEQNREGIMTSCGTPPCGAFNPSGNVTRADMASFLIHAQRGPGFQPPPATGTIFTDVHPGDYNADYIEQLYNEGITGGCQSSPPKYCPTSPNTRGQMAVFMNKTFQLP